MIWEAYTLTKPGSVFRINVFESFTDNPLDAILRLPTTADYNVWALDRIWVPYPNATFMGLAMTTPTRLPLDNLWLKQTCWDVLQIWTGEGFSVQSALSIPHVCSFNAGCPATWRESSDAGCASFKLAVLLPRMSGFDRSSIDFPDVSWTLDATSKCSVGDIRGRPGARSIFLCHLRQTLGRNTNRSYKLYLFLITNYPFVNLELCDTSDWFHFSSRPWCTINGRLNGRPSHQDIHGSNSG